MHLVPSKYPSKEYTDTIHTIRRDELKNWFELRHVRISWVNYPGNSRTMSTFYQTPPVMLLFHRITILVLPRKRPSSLGPVQYLTCFHEVLMSA